MMEKRKPTEEDKLRYYAVVVMRMSLADVQQMPPSELEAWVKMHQGAVREQERAADARGAWEAKLGEVLERVAREGVPMPTDFLKVLGGASTGELAVFAAARALAQEVVAGKLTAKLAKGLLVGTLKVPEEAAREILAGAHPYTPPPEVMERAEALLSTATPAEHEAAGQGFAAYASVTDNVSSITGETLPGFPEVGPLVRAGWLAITWRLQRLTLERFVDGLNEALEADPEAVSALFLSRSECNAVLAQHHSVRVREEAAGGYSVGVLALLNAALSTLAGPGCRQGVGPIAQVRHPGEEGRLARFVLVEDNLCWRCSEPTAETTEPCGACGRAPPSPQDS